VWVVGALGAAIWVGLGRKRGRGFHSPRPRAESASAR
jgi:hypothetical protein